MQKEKLILMFVFLISLVSLNSNALNITAWTNVYSVNKSEPIYIYANATTGVSSCWVNITYPNETKIKLDLNGTYDQTFWHYEYQEVANETTIWAGNDFQTNADNYNDSNWATFASCGGYVGGRVSKYFKPNNSFEAIWRVKDSVGTENISIYGTLFNLNETKLELGARSFFMLVGFPPSVENQEIWFYNYVSGIVLRSTGLHSGLAEFYEENITWKVSDLYYYLNFNNTTQIGQYNLIVYCNNTTNSIYNSSLLQFNVTDATTVKNISFSPTIYETQTDNFTLKLETTSVVADINSTLYWNGYTYNQTYKTYGGNTWNFTFVVPIRLINRLNKTVPIAFSYTIFYTDGSNYTTTIQLPFETNYNFSTATDYVFNSSRINVTGGYAFLRPQNNSLSFYADFDSSINATYSRNGGSLTGTATGNAVQVSDVYKFGSGSLKVIDTATSTTYVTYSTTNNIATANQIGTISFWYRPNYTGTPAANRYLLMVSSVAANRIGIWHASSNGFLYLGIWNSAASQIVSIGSTFAPTANQWYHIEANYDLTAGATRFFVDGVQVDVTSTATGTRTTPDVIRIVGTDKCDGWIDDFAYYDVVQHTANFNQPTSTAANYSTEAASIEAKSFINNSLIIKLTEFNITESLYDGTNVSYVLSNDNSTWWYWNGSGWDNSSIDVSKSNLPSVVDQNIDTFGVGDGTIFWKAYLNTLGNYTPFLDAINIKYQTGNYTQLVKQAYLVSALYPSKTDWIEGDSISFQMNITKSVDYANITANVTFNNSIYNCILLTTNSTFNTYTCSFVLPKLDDGVVNKTFIYAPYVLIQTPGDSRIAQTPTGNITVYRMTITNCSNGALGEALRFYILDEDTDAQITGSQFEANFNVSKDVVYRLYNFTLSGRGNYSFCIYPDWSNFSVVRGNIYYTNVSYDSRRYFIIDSLISNVTEMVNLYLLKTTSSGQVNVQVYDTEYQVKPYVTIRVMKENVGGGTYQQVASEIADNEGKTVFNLEFNNKYNFIIEENGQVIESFNELLIAGTPPIDKVFVVRSVVQEVYWDVINGISFDCQNSSDSLWCSYSVPTGLIARSFLDVDQIGILGNFQTCRQSLTSTSGTLFCTLGSTTGKTFVYTFYVLDSTNAKIILETGTIQGYYEEAEELGDMGLFMTFIVVLLLGSGVGYFNPSAGIIASALGLLMCYMLGYLGATLIPGLVGWVILSGIILVYRMRI